MTIKQQGGIFGRNPTFNDVNASDVTTINAEVTNQLDVKTISMVSNNPSIYLDDTDVADRNTLLRNQSGIFRIQDVADDGSTITQVQLAHSTGDLTVSTGNLVIGTSGKGIDFSATSGTGTSELFDDYEEGTWTPSYTPTTGSFTTMTYNNQEGYYTKVGDLVYINCLISTNNSNPSGGSGDLLISGLPYTCGASADHSLAISGVINWGGDYPLAGLVTESSSTIKFQYRTAINGATSSLNVSDMATSTSSNRNYIRFSGCYKV